jgi:hypothetical protein
MSIAENIEELIEAGYGDQAYQMANSEAIWIERSDESITFGFADDSSIELALAFHHTLQ